MIGSEAWQSVLVATEAHPAVHLLGSDEFDDLVVLFVGNFVGEPTSLWWWQNLKVAPTRIEYSVESFFEALEPLVPMTEPTVLIVTNEGSAPEGAIVGPFHEILAIVKDSLGFEFVLTSLSAEWAIFDTHHNEILRVGAVPGQQE